MIAGRSLRADGYNITLKREPSPDGRKLYYVNLGGYDKTEFSELHKNMFVVAKSEAEAKAKALKTVSHWKMPHKDNLYEAEKCFCLNNSAEESALHIHFEKTDDETPAPFQCAYWPIGI